MNEYVLLENTSKFYNNNYHKGLFKIFYNKRKNIIYKKIECIDNTYEINISQRLVRILKNKNQFEIYKNIIENTYKKDYIGNYTIKGFDVEHDGSYKCEYINGFRLDKIPNNLTNDIKNILIKKLYNLLNDVNSKHITSGDWALHNIVFNGELKNIDLEGFYSYQTLPTWMNVSIINTTIKNLIKNL